MLLTLFLVLVAFFIGVCAERQRTRRNPHAVEQLWGRYDEVHIELYHNHDKSHCWAVRLPQARVTVFGEPNQRLLEPVIKRARAQAEWKKMEAPKPWPAPVELPQRTTPLVFNECHIPGVNVNTRPELSTERKPQLLYYEDAIDGWTFVPPEMEDVITLLGFDKVSEMDEKEEVQLRLKRVDMSEAEIAALPED